jgi:hypothetical protein
MTDELVQVGNLYVTRLTITVNPDMDWRALFEHIHDVARVSESWTRPAYQHGDRYRHKLQLEQRNKLICDFQFSPLKETNGAMRISLNPHATTSREMKDVQQFLVAVFGTDIEREMRKARISQLDVAVDICGEQLEQLDFRFAGARQVSNSLDKHGNLKCIRFGAPESDEKIAISQELIKNSSGFVIIEALMSLPRIPLHKIKTIRNPFLPLHIIRLPSEPLENRKTLWRLFIDSCRHRGVQAALARIEDKELRCELLRRLQKRLRWNWWDPHAVWGGLEPALQGLGIFSKHAGAEVSDNMTRSGSSLEGVVPHMPAEMTTPASSLVSSSTEQDIKRLLGI